MITIGQYGWKIRNYKAATVYGKNIGIRDKYDYTDAVLHHSLFTKFLKSHGMKTDKNDESTRDIICLDFQFGLRSYEEEISHLKEMRKKANKEQNEETKIEKLALIDTLEEKVKSRKDLYKKLSKADIRKYLYENGADITYSHVNKKTGEITEETIHYKMLYRNPSKAKEGSVMFCCEELYDTAYEWITMGIGKLLPKHNARIVEISAYAPLTASAIEGTVTIPVEDVLILKDQESYFKTIADIVRAEDYDVYVQEYDPETKKKSPKLITKKKCVVHREETEVKNVLWDGQALIESSVMPEWCNGMALLRNHFFKACAFKTNIQKFFVDYCNEHGIDYSTYQVTDMFGVKHFARNIKIITTDNAVKIWKFKELIGGDNFSAYQYWVDKVKTDGCLWGIVKTDHVSKYNNLQRTSYQMINTLPCSEEDIYKIAQTSVDYVERLKNNNDVYIEFLQKNANAVNSNEMFVDLYKWNPDFSNSKFWKANKSKIINEYVSKLKKGKIMVEGDNLTVLGNPYALLLYAVGEDWEKDPTFSQEDGTIQVYTRRFNNGEYLCGIRNPHNSANNLGYFHNIKHPLMEKYFDFSNNIMAVNCIHTDIQPRMNGMDFDSDFNLVTNQPQMVESARIAYKEYPTVVNEIPESGISYDNTLAEYARMDTNMQGAQKAIGGTSDSAQLAQSYMWTKVANNEFDDEYRQLYENVVILAVLAQVAIDGCKRIYSVNAEDDLRRIRAQKCMNREKDFPVFFKTVRAVSSTKNGKERPKDEIQKDRRKLADRINYDIICPMNWLYECFDKIQGAKKNATIDTLKFMIPKPENAKATDRQMSKIRKIVEEYDSFTRYYLIANGNSDSEYEYDSLIELKTSEVINTISGIKTSVATVYRLIETSFGYEGSVNKNKVYKNATKYITRMLNVLYKANKEKFLGCFIHF